ncbi:hypothetical protein PITC_077420 [Penicillium italicum]|uniref:Uncharacterized protein n=1 Tax=Penicillium italicum TaxID=40296 RepID=A0A0A2KPL3_PENIT|nr:hypothetical protein PITC_077420 [Penicillium italicum]
MVISVAQCAASHWKLHGRNRNAGTGTARWSLDASWPVRQGTNNATKVMHLKCPGH